ncbi:MAG: hypothetical protein R3250_02430, partial [Melioribacteraceae bacterium]|nr:hypothetical protein [Melioribacteraceae bacterium]
LIKYLLEFKLNNEDLLKLEDLGKIFELIKNGSNQTEALLEVVSLPAEEWWPDFFKRYIPGEIIDLNSNVFTDTEIIDGSWAAANNYDSYLILDKISDLSAQLFAIDLQNSAPSPSTTLSIILNSLGDAEKINGLTALVFADNGGKLDLIRSGTEISISNIKNEYYDQNITRFLVVVVNSNGNKDMEKPYTDITDYSIWMGLNEQTEFTGCFFDFDIAAANYDTEYKDGTSAELLGLGDFSDYFDLSFDGATYSGILEEKYEISSDSIFTKVQISFQISDDKSKISSMIAEIESNTRSIYSVTDDFREGNYRRFEFVDIPLLSGFADRFEVSGEAVCNGNHIQSFVGRAYYVDYFESTLKNWACDNTSRIYLDLD